LADGYSYGLADGRLKTAMDSGPPKVRRRFSSATRPVSGQIYGSIDDMARLERFWMSETAGGVLPFVIPDQNTDGLMLVTEDGAPLLGDDGQELANSSYWLAMFGDAPPQQSVVSGLIYKANFNLTILP
jgi:hypothetical protein